MHPGGAHLALILVAAVLHDEHAQAAAPGGLARIHSHLALGLRLLGGRRHLLPRPASHSWSEHIQQERLWPLDRGGLVDLQRSRDKLCDWLWGRACHQVDTQRPGAAAAQFVSIAESWTYGSSSMCTVHM